MSLCINFFSLIFFVQLILLVSTIQYLRCQQPHASFLFRFDVSLRYQCLYAYFIFLHTHNSFPFKCCFVKVVLNRGKYTSPNPQQLLIPIFLLRLPCVLWKVSCQLKCGKQLRAACKRKGSQAHIIDGRKHLMGPSFEQTDRQNFQLGYSHCRYLLDTLWMSLASTFYHITLFNVFILSRQ